MIKKIANKIGFISQEQHERDKLRYYTLGQINMRQRIVDEVNAKSTDYRIHAVGIRLCRDIEAIQPETLTLKD